jgi:hypothetical protein
MSWLYSRALVEEYLAGTCSDGEPSAPLNGNLTQLAYLPPDKMTAFSRLSRFGMTFKPLTADRGEALLTLYLADFRAKTSAAQEKGLELMGSAQGCGEKWHGSLARYDPDSRSWKTHQFSLLGGLTEFSETWPRWGLMRNGELFPQKTLVPHIDEKESGLWPTPVADDTGLRKKPYAQGGTPLSLAVQAKWPTPQASDNKQRATANSTARRMKLGKQISLEAAVKFWPTPTAHNAKEAAYPAEYTRNTPTLSAQAGGSLNPMWVEWLMGWPLGWTDLGPLEMDKFHLWRQQLLNCSPENKK